MSEIIVDIHLPGLDHPLTGVEFRDPRLSSYGRYELGAAIADLGATVAYSRATADADPTTGLPFAREARFAVEGGEPVVYLKSATTPFTEVGAVRNISKAIGHGVPELNPIPVRELARDKVAADQLLQEIGAGKSFAAWMSGQTLDEAFDRIPTDDIVVKPRLGRLSQGVMITTKKLLHERAKSGDIKQSDDWIIEERLGLAVPVPIRGRDQQEQEKIDVANEAGIPKELRGYCFGREGGRILTSYLIRVGSNGDESLGNNSWIFIDPDTVPDEPRQIVARGLAELEERTGHREMHVAFDFVYAKLHGETDNRWIGMEIAGTEPKLVTPEEDLAVGTEQTTMLARQLYRVAQAGGTA